MKKLFLELLWWSICVAVVLCVVCIMSSCVQERSDERYNLIKARVDSLTQTRALSWELAAGTPDSIYFVSWSGDTTWYKKVSKEKNESRNSK